MNIVNAGDTTNAQGLIILLGIAAIAIVVALIFMFKRKKK